MDSALFLEHLLSIWGYKEISERCGSIRLFRDSQGNFDFIIVKYYHDMAKYTIKSETSPTERVIPLSVSLKNLWEARKTCKKKNLSSSFFFLSFS